MPTYEFRCTTCATVFEERRSMAASDDPASCPEGHPGAKRLLSVRGDVRLGWRHLPRRRALGAELALGRLLRRRVPLT